MTTRDGKRRRSVSPRNSDSEMLSLSTEKFERSAGSGRDQGAVCYAQSKHKDSSRNFFYGN